VVWICIFDGVKVMILNRKFLKFEIDFDFVLIAVTTSLKDYRACYLINKFLNFNFVKTDDLELIFIRGAKRCCFQNTIIIGKLQKQISIL
jgi:hypothetical protein